MRLIVIRFSLSEALMMAVKTACIYESFDDECSMKFWQCSCLKILPFFILIEVQREKYFREDAGVEFLV